jgi:enoyl-CoA hydratase/carnithine racemase
MNSNEMEAVIFDVSDGIATLTLNRPSQRNALDSVMQGDCRACLGNPAGPGNPGAGHS